MKAKTMIWLLYAIQLVLYVLHKRKRMLYLATESWARQYMERKMVILIT